MIPDALPVLSKGNHDPATGRACAMSAVSWLSGHPEDGEAPRCVHPVLRTAFVAVNDWVDDDERQRLWPLIARVIGTWPSGLDPASDADLSARLALWAARSTLADADPSDPPWTAGVLRLVARALDGDEDAATRLAGLDYPSPDETAWRLKTMAVAGAVAAIRGDRDAAKVAAEQGALRADASGRIRWLTGLVDEHARLTGHGEADLDRAAVARLGELVGVAR